MIHYSISLSDSVSLSGVGALLRLESVYRSVCESDRRIKGRVLCGKREKARYTSPLVCDWPAYLHRLLSLLMIGQRSKC